MMKLFAGMTLMGFSSAAPMASSSTFASWVTEHGKTYSSVRETTARQAVFEANMQMIEEHNSKGLSYTMGAGPYTDMTNKEWATTYAHGARSPSLALSLSLCLP